MVLSWHPCDAISIDEIALNRIIGVKLILKHSEKKYTESQKTPGNWAKSIDILWQQHANAASENRQIRTHNTNENVIFDEINNVKHVFGAC